MVANMRQTLKYRNGLIVSLSLALIGLLLVVPFDLVVSPERQLTFVDQFGAPVADAEVWQIWHQYSLGLSGDVIIRTDVNGTIYLPKHVVNTSVKTLLFGALKELRELGIHASYSSSEHVMIKISQQNIKSYYNGKGLENERVVIKR